MKLLRPGSLSSPPEPSPVSPNRQTPGILSEAEGPPHLASAATRPLRSPALDLVTTVLLTASYRAGITHHLASPNLALTLVVAGILLILAECNLPGAILPGALGLLLLLSGAFGLSLHPLRPLALLVLLLASALLALSAFRPLFGLPALLGTASLVLGLHLLLPSGPRLSTPLVIAVAITLGLATSLLGRIAWRARQNKTTPSTPRPAE